MKKICLLALMVISCLPLAAAGPDRKPLFCIDSGTHLHYESRDAKTRELLRTTDMYIEGIEDTPEGILVHYSLLLRKKGRHEMYGGRTSFTTRIAADGDTYIDFAASLCSFVRGAFPNLPVTASGTPAVLPVDMKPGDSIPEARGKAELPIGSFSVEVSDREVLRNERISTPAGTFDCVVVRDRREQDLMLKTKDQWMVNWYTPGIGYVRHIVYDRDMNAVTVEELCRIEKY